MIITDRHERGFWSAGGSLSDQTKMENKVRRIEERIKQISKMETSRLSFDYKIQIVLHQRDQHLRTNSKQSKSGIWKKNVTEVDHFYVCIYSMTWIITLCPTYMLPLFLRNHFLFNFYHGWLSLLCRPPELDIKLFFFPLAFFRMSCSGFFTAKTRWSYNIYYKEETSLGKQFCRGCTLAITCKNLA